MTMPLDGVLTRIRDKVERDGQHFQPDSSQQGRITALCAKLDAAPPDDSQHRGISYLDSFAFRYASGTVLIGYRDENHSALLIAPRGNPMLLLGEWDNLVVTWDRLQSYGA